MTPAAQRAQAPKDTPPPAAPAAAPTIRELAQAEVDRVDAEWAKAREAQAAAEAAEFDAIKAAALERVCKHSPLTAWFPGVEWEVVDAKPRSGQGAYEQVVWVRPAADVSLEGGVFIVSWSDEPAASKVPPTLALGWLRPGLAQHARGSYGQPTPIRGMGDVAAALDRRDRDSWAREVTD